MANRLLKIGLPLAGGLLALAATAYFYYVYAPLPPEPTLSARPQAATLRVGARQRTYLAYLPVHLPPAAPVVLVLHGSGLDGATMRQWCGYEFDQLADRYGFAVLYPDGYEKNWNDCRRAVPVAASIENVDDVGFLRALVAQLPAAHHLRPTAVYAFGFSNGGFLAFRVASEAPDLFTALAAVSANLPTPATARCFPQGPTPRVLLVAGTADPVVPYAGGTVTLFGQPRGQVLSAAATAEAFARCNQLAAPLPDQRLPGLPAPGGQPVSYRRWQRGGQPVVALYTVPSGGHAVPQAAFRFPRVLGPTATGFDAPRQALAFFGLLPAAATSATPSQP